MITDWQFYSGSVHAAPRARQVRVSKRGGIWFTRDLAELAAGTSISLAYCARTNQLAVFPESVGATPLPVTPQRQQWMLVRGSPYALLGLGLLDRLRGATLPVSAQTPAGALFAVDLPAPGNTPEGRAQAAIAAHLERGGTLTEEFRASLGLSESRLRPILDNVIERRNAERREAKAK